MYLDVNLLSLHVTVVSEKCWEVLRAFGTTLIPLGPYLEFRKMLTVFWKFQRNINLDSVGDLGLVDR